MSYQPSFLYSALDDETKQLSADLEELGGGDASVKPFELHVIATPPNGTIHSTSSSPSPSHRSPSQKQQQQQCIWLHDNSVGLRDSLAPPDTPSSEAMKYFPATSTTTLPRIIASASASSSSPLHNSTKASIPPFTPLSDIPKWLLDGFNATLIAVG